MNDKRLNIIVKVFLCHPTPSIEEDPEVKKSKLWIKKRYREIRNSNKDKGNVRFTDAEIQAKIEWLKEYISKIA